MLRTDSQKIIEILIDLKDNNFWYIFHCIGEPLVGKKICFLSPRF